MKHMAILAILSTVTCTSVSHTKTTGVTDLINKMCSDEICIQNGIRSLSELTENEKVAAFDALKQASSGRESSSFNAANLLVGWFTESRASGLGDMYYLARKVAESGHYVSGDVYYLLAQCHLEASCGQERDSAQALNYLRLAARKGNAKAVNALVPYLDRNTDDGRTTTATLKRLAEAGDAASMHNLAVLYGTGWFGRVENEFARQWYGKAAAKGHRISLFSLGRMMIKGIGGEQETVLGYALITLAADAGEPNARRYLSEMGDAGIDKAQVMELRKQWLSANTVPLCFVPGRCPDLVP